MAYMECLGLILIVQVTFLTRIECVIHMCSSMRMQRC